MSSEARATEDEPEQLIHELAREFTSPVGLLDPYTSQWGGWGGSSQEEYPELPNLVRFATQAFEDRTAKATVWKPEGNPDRIWLVLFLENLSAGELIAVAPFRASDTSNGSIPFQPVVGHSDGDSSAWKPASSSGRCGPACPEPALKAWGEQVVSRMQTAAGDAGSPASRGRMTSMTEHLVIGRLIRRMRISDHPRRFQSLTANVVRTSLGVEAVAWVPAENFEPVIVSGEIAGFDPSAYRTLAPLSLKDSAFVMNKPHDGANDPQNGVRRYAVVTGGTAGWLIAANPPDGHSFGGTEVEIMQYAASLIATQFNNAKIYADLKELLFGIIRALTAAIDAKDPYTCGHSERVARIAVRLAEEMGVPPQKRSDLYLAGLLHDIGKIGIDDDVLKKTGPLNPEEYRKIQSHVEIGVTILNDLRKLHHILPGVRHHHESHDGTGYPDNLSGEEIPLEARILAVADSFDAMSSNRPYRRRLTPMQINEILRKGSGVQWDPQVIDALFACRMDVEAIRQKGLGESLLGAVDVTLGRR